MFLQHTLHFFLNVLFVIAEKILLRTVAAGPVPNHVAFIMDGNRRYARARSMNILKGHEKGATTIKKVLDACLQLNIKCVSVYAFSIENFKRSREELEGLMNLFEKLVAELSSEGDFCAKNGVRVNVIGRWGLLPANLQLVSRDAENRTAHHKRMIFNVHIAYTSRDEMTTAVQSAVRKSLLTEVPTIISEQSINDQLMTTMAGSPPLDILVRTSGVHRLSDFLLWQCCETTQIQILTKCWPEFGLFDLVCIILDYQRKVWAKEADGVQNHAGFAS